MPSKNGNKPVTRTDLEAGLEKVRTELRGDIAKTQWQIKESGDRLRAEMKDGFRDVMGTIDSFLSKLETYARESVTIPKTLDEHGRALKDHEERLTRLESARS